MAGGGAWVEPELRRVGMVFQDGALFPHLTVAGNVGFGKPRAGRVEECLTLVGLAHRAAPTPMSCRAVNGSGSPSPERSPSNRRSCCWTSRSRHSMPACGRACARRWRTSCAGRGPSALFVTHDQQEALSLADRITLLRDGRVEQEGPPEEIYAHPASRWAAGFLGAVDVLPGTVAEGMAVCELGRFPADGTPAGAVDVLVRPEAVAIGERER